MLTLMSRWQLNLNNRAQKTCLFNDSKYFGYILYNLGAFYCIGKTEKKMISGKFAIWKKRWHFIRFRYFKLNWDVTVYLYNILFYTKPSEANFFFSKNSNFLFWENFGRKTSKAMFFQHWVRGYAIHNFLWGYVGMLNDES